MKYEESIIRLEKILEEINSNDVPVDTLVKLFDEGNKIAITCQKKLTEAKSKMKIIINKNNKITESDLK